MEGPHHGPQPPGGGAQLAQSVQEHLAAAAPASLRIAPRGGSHLGHFGAPLLYWEGVKVGILNELPVAICFISITPPKIIHSITWKV